MRLHFTLLVGIFFLFQCHTSYNQTEKEESPAPQAEKSTDSLKFFNDQTPEKFKISSRMIAFVDEMSAEIETYDDAESFPLLITRLYTLHAQMMSNQNEKGEGKEPLEKWMSSFKKLLDQSTELTRQEAIEQFKGSIKDFTDTFYA